MKPGSPASERVSRMPRCCGRGPRHTHPSRPILAGFLLSSTLVSSLVRSRQLVFTRGYVGAATESNGFLLLEHKKTEFEWDERRVPDPIHQTEKVGLIARFPPTARRRRGRRPLAPRPPNLGMHDPLKEHLPTSVSRRASTASL